MEEVEGIRGVSLFFAGLLCCVSSSTASVQSSVLSQNFGSVAVNSSSGAATVSYQITALTGTPVFGLQYNLEFSLGRPSCTATTPVVCSLQVSFSPKFPGLRRDAIRVLDSNGNLLAATFLEGVGLAAQEVILPGAMTTFAGSGALWPGWAENGGLAVRAALGNPQGLAVDGAGNVFISDSLNQVVRRVDAATGIITIVAGNSGATALGDGGRATSASLNAPAGLAVDGAGNLYIADSQNNRVRRVDGYLGIITTVAGNGTASSNLGDGGLATSASLNWPSDVALDSAGNLFIADRLNNRIRKVDSTGVMTTVAGGGAPSAGTDGLGNGGLATNAVLNRPTGLTFDSSDHLYIADAGNNLVREVNGGIISVVAGTGSPNDSGDGGLANGASLYKPTSVRVDGAGNLYVADSGNNAVREVNAAGIITTVAPQSGSSSSAELNAPSSVAVDSFGDIYIADLGNSLVRWVKPWTGNLTFGDTSIGEISAAQTFTVANIGNQPLTFSGFGVAGNFVQQSSGATDCSLSSTVMPGSACSISIAFAPQVGGSLTGSVGVLTNSLNAGGGAATSVVLSGRGTGSVPSDPTLDTATLLFSSQMVGATSTQTVTLSNPGSGTLAIGGISISGSTDFAFDASNTTCGSTLAAGRTCAVSIKFTPSRTGSRSATLSFADSMSGTGFAQSVFLLGTGTVPPPVVSPSSLGFSNGGVGSLPVTQTVTLSNPGSLPLNIGAIALSGASDFTIASTCQSTLAANSSCTVAVTFTSTATGMESATLTFTDSVGSVYSQAVALSTGNAAISITGSTSNLGAQTRGLTSFPIPIQLQNLRGSSLAITAITITGNNASDFKQVNDCGSSLPLGQGCVVWVSYSPTGNSAVSATASLTITDSAPGSPHSIGISGTATGMSQALIDVDSPSYGGTVSGTISLGGWAISDNALITGVSIAIDGVAGPQATYGINRPDVCAVYPGRAGCPNVGWSSSLVTTKLTDGPHQLTISTASTQGTTTISVPFKVANLSTGNRTTKVYIDVPSNSTAPLAGSARFAGWAIDDQASIQSVNLTIDGVPFESATYGGARPDVCFVYASRAGCPNVGWSAQVDTTQLANGIHTLGVTAKTADARYSTSTAIFTVANGSAGPIIAYVDSPGSTAVSGTLHAAGWAVDASATIASVVISIDGVVQGTAATAWRPDVCSAFSNPPGCPNVGWSEAIDTTQFADGVHTFQVTATSTDSHRVTTTKQFTISNLRDRYANTTNAVIDTPNAASGTLSGTVAVGGWAIDAATPISSVRLAVDGVPFTTVRESIARPDVCAVYPATVACPNVGWQGVLDTTSLADGRHTLEMIATSQQGKRIIRTVSFVSSNASSWAARGEVIWIDAPLGSAVVSGQIAVSGWAVNRVDTVTGVSIAVDGVVMGSAQYGGSRPDVCTFFQSAYNCPNVGWNYTLDTGLLSNGPHVVQAIENAGLGKAVVSRTINVVNPVSSTTLCIDLPSASAQYGGKVQFSGWAIDNASSIASVSVSVDGVPIGPAVYGNSRPDVCAVYPGRAGCPSVGWMFSLDTTQFVNGPHSFQLTGLTSGGQRTSVSVLLNVAN